MAGSCRTGSRLPASIRVRRGWKPTTRDPDGQTLLIWYPAATPRSDYVRAAIKIESGAKSALDPNSEVPIKPYVDDDLPALDLTVPAVRTVDPERTFWDKVVILHGLRRWFDKRGVARRRPTRVASSLRFARCSDGDAESSADRHWRGTARACPFVLQPARTSISLSAAPGTFALVTHGRHGRCSARDYEAMAGMIFGTVPPSDRMLADHRRSRHWNNEAQQTARLTGGAGRRPRWSGLRAT